MSCNSIEYWLKLNYNKSTIINTHQQFSLFLNVVRAGNMSANLHRQRFNRPCRSQSTNSSPPESLLVRLAAVISSQVALELSQSRVSRIRHDLNIELCRGHDLNDLHVHFLAHVQVLDRGGVIVNHGEWGQGQNVWESRRGSERGGRGCGSGGLIGRGARELIC